MARWAAVSSTPALATTIIAAEMTGRACHAIELSPAYVDVAVARWEAFTGEVAVRAEDGARFDGLGPAGAPGGPTGGPEDGDDFHASV